MADKIEKRAIEIEARLREQVLHHRDLSNPLYMSEHGRLLHEAAETIAALRAALPSGNSWDEVMGANGLPPIAPPAPLAEVGA